LILVFKAGERAQPRDFRIADFPASLLEKMTLNLRQRRFRR
jgi:hypothetical protein